MSPLARSLTAGGRSIKKTRPAPTAIALLRTESPGLWVHLSSPVFASMANSSTDSLNSRLMSDLP